MVKILVTVMLLALPQFVYSAVQNRLSPTSRITSVTVYEDRAMVTRTAHLTLEPKEYEVSIQNLPEGVLEESVRASGKGESRVTITGLEVEKTFLEKTGDARVRILEDEIQQLEDEKRRIQDQITARQSQQKFLTSIQVLSSDQISKELTLKRPNVVEYQQVLDFLYNGLAGVNGEIQNLEVRLRELQRKLNALQQEIQQVRTAQALTRNTVNVSLHAKTGGTFDLEVSYVISGAGWYPSYDARVIGNPQKVDLQYYGEVWQRTGEDWPEAKISLSTARPSIGGRTPELTPWYLNFYLYQESKDERLFGLKEKMSEGEELQAPAEVTQFDKAKIRESGTSVLFEIAEKKEVLSDGNPQKFTIAMDQFKPVMRYEAVPKLSPYAYLHSTVKNEEDYPLLAGPVSLFMGPDFIGKSRISNVAPTEEFPLDLGIDERIKIKRELVKKETEKVGIFSTKERVLYVYKTTITSFKKEKIVLTLKDQHPVSQNKEIVVSNVEFNPRPSKEDPNKGELLWEFELSPQEKREITLQFSVEYPPGKGIAGLF